MSTYTYDTGALLAAERDDRRMWTLHRKALERGERPIAPAGVLAQSWRGGPQAHLSRLLRGCRVEALDGLMARTVGAACAVAGTADIVDASVVVGALRRGDACVTSDPGDLVAVAGALGRRLPVFAV